MGIPNIIDSCDARKCWNIWMQTLTGSRCSKDVSDGSEHSWGSWMEWLWEKTWLPSVDSWSHSFGDVVSACVDFETVTATIKHSWIWKIDFLEFSLGFCVWHLGIRITICKGWYGRNIVCKFNQVCLILCLREGSLIHEGCWRRFKYTMKLRYELKSELGSVVIVKRFH
jgi:hypothetical protein